MYWESVLSSAIEAGIGIVGFSGIIVAISSRGQGEWSSVDRVRLYSVLGSSFGPIFLAFLPFILLSAGMPIVLTWRVGSAIFFLSLAVVAVIRFRQFRRASSQLSRHDSAIFVFVVGLLALQIANVAVIGADWPYLVGVVGGLGIAAAQFVRLLLQLRS